MKANKFSLILITSALLWTTMAHAQVEIKILTPHGNVLAYQLSAGKVSFSSDNNGVVHITADQLKALKDEKISVDITDKRERGFYWGLELYESDSSGKGPDPKKSIGLFNTTLRQLVDKKIKTFYFVPNPFNEVMSEH